MPTVVAEFMTLSATTIRADQSVYEAPELLKAQDIGALAIERDPDSALADISAEWPNI